VTIDNNLTPPSETVQFPNAVKPVIVWQLDLGLMLSISTKWSTSCLGKCTLFGVRRSWRWSWGWKWDHFLSIDGKLVAKWMYLLQSTTTAFW